MLARLLSLRLPESGDGGAAVELVRNHLEGRVHNSV